MNCKIWVSVSLGLYFLIKLLITVGHFEVKAVSSLQVHERSKNGP